MNQQIQMSLIWRYASGEAMERFLSGLAERRLEALACDGCGRRYVPPRPFCGSCHQRLSRWVPVADEGVIEAWTVMWVPIVDGRTGRPRKTPYGMGLIRLDGADTTVNHLLDVADPARLAIGQRVRAVWRDDRIGSLNDIEHFEVGP